MLFNTRLEYRNINTSRKIPCVIKLYLNVFLGGVLPCPTQPSQLNIILPDVYTFVGLSERYRNMETKRREIASEIPFPKRSITDTFFETAD